MIVDAVFGLLMAAVGWIIGLLPVAPTLDLSGFGRLVGFIGAFDSFLPVHEAVAMVTLWLGVNAAIFLYRVLKEVWSWIPLKAT